MSSDYVKYTKVINNFSATHGIDLRDTPIKELLFTISNYIHLPDYKEVDTHQKVVNFIATELYDRGYYTGAPRKPLYGCAINNVYTKSDNVSRFYNIWRGMIQRCYDNDYTNLRPTYKNTNCCDAWLVFSNFLAWAEDQSPQTKGWHLDKDILILGNNTYSPDTCVFVEGALNLFVSGGNKTSKMYDVPVGVIYNKTCGKYCAKSSYVESNKPVVLGYYETPEDAHKAYLEFKQQQAEIWVDKIQKSPYYRKKGELCNALLNRYKFKNYGYEEQL